MRSLIAVLFAVSLLAVLPGCLVTGGSTVEQGGMKITDATLDQIEVGTTTEAWVLATLGTPSSSTEVSDNPGVKVVRYDYTEVHRDQVSVFLIVNSHSNKEKLVRTFFEFQDGVVQRFWIERSP